LEAQKAGIADYQLFAAFGTKKPFSLIIDYQLFSDIPQFI
jgi:hypothetical protein